MTYTIQLDLTLDEKDITEDNLITKFIKDQLDSAGISVNNCRVIEVND